MIDAQDVRLLVSLACYVVAIHMFVLSENKDDDHNDDNGAY